MESTTKSKFNATSRKQAKAIAIEMYRQAYVNGHFIIEFPGLEGENLALEVHQTHYFLKNCKFQLRKYPLRNSEALEMIEQCRTLKRKDCIELRRKKDSFVTNSTYLQLLNQKIELSKTVCPKVKANSILNSFKKEVIASCTTQ